MSNSIDLKPVLEFLSKLEKNNHKAWFDKNRATYEIAKGRFETFVDRVIGEFGVVEDLTGVAAKDCVMRIYRDIRFSKDKSPYRTSMGASIAPGGRKSSRLPYHLHLQPHGESLIAGGLYMPTPAQLAKFREAVDHDARLLKTVLNDNEFKRYFGTVGGETVKTAPQGYTRDHPEIELLRLKQVVAVRHLSDETVLSSNFPSHVVKAFTALKPFLNYLNATVQ